METQTVQKAEVRVNCSIFISGVESIDVKLFPKDEDCAEFVRVNIGRATIFFSDGEQQFKAFVGEMIKAVANLK